MPADGGLLLCPRCTGSGVVRRCPGCDATAQEECLAACMACRGAGGNGEAEREDCPSCLGTGLRLCLSAPSWRFRAEG